jgi:hypothetical protein
MQQITKEDYFIGLILQELISRFNFHSEVEDELEDALPDLIRQAISASKKVCLELNNLPELPPQTLSRHPNLTVQGSHIEHLSLFGFVAWVPVDGVGGRLPAERELVLCAAKNQWTGHELLVGYRIGLKWLTLDGVDPMPDVTHWLSIPTVPK